MKEQKKATASRNYKKNKIMTPILQSRQKMERTIPISLNKGEVKHDREEKNIQKESEVE